MRSTTTGFFVAGLLALGSVQTTPSAPASARRPSSPKPVSYAKDIVPLFEKYCFGCHGDKKKGDLDLRLYREAATAQQERGVFERVLKNLESHEMPPEKKLQPSPEERARIVAWIENEVFQCDCTKPDPGRVTIRRLNRAEYNNTIRDLVGVDFQPAEDFPQDDVGYGFDNIGDVLSMSPILLEKYLTAAEKIMARAIVTDLTPGPRTNRIEAANLSGTAPGEATDGGLRRLGREGDINVALAFPDEGEYVLRARAYGEQAGPEPTRMALRIDDREVARFDVTAEIGEPQVYECRVKLEPGKKKFSAAYLNNYVRDKGPSGKREDRNLVIDWLEVVAPAETKPRALPESHRRILTTKGARPVPAAQEILTRFATRAYRRPAAGAEVERLMKIFATAMQEEKNFERGIQLALTAVLVSPHFLFRGELQPEPDNPGSVHPINDYALASRLAYFLWSSLPDEELSALAEQGTLRQNLDGQVRRMLKDAKARALVDNFAGQWLQLRNLKSIAPDTGTFPAWNDGLRAAMQRETELFFAAIVQEDRSILEFLDADYTFVNETLARLYGLSGVKGEEFQRVSLKRTPRGGILTHASILTLTSNPTRTSPVKRGKYVLENILGTPPPPPPPEVPELKEDKEARQSASLRQRMEQHRENVLCASCHARMDPIGFGFENFDGIGAWRTQDEGFPIDPAGKLVSGESFKGAGELTAVLVKKKRDEFVHCLSEKMLTYALGRGLEYYDKCALDKMAQGLAKGRYKFSVLIAEVVKSTPFQMRRGEGDRMAKN